MLTGQITNLARNICPVSQNQFKLYFEGHEDLFLKELQQENIILYCCSASRLRYHKKFVVS